MRIKPLSKYGHSRKQSHDCDLNVTEVASVCCVGKHLLPANEKNHWRTAHVIVQNRPEPYSAPDHRVEMASLKWLVKPCAQTWNLGGACQHNSQGPRDWFGNGLRVAAIEVDLAWAGKLHAYFVEKGYCAVFAQYGHDGSGFLSGPEMQRIDMRFASD